MNDTMTVADTAKKRVVSKVAKKPVKQAKTNGKVRIPVTRWTVPDDRKITITKKGATNPKSPMSPSWKRYELYKVAGTVGEYRKLMRAGKAGGKSHFANLDLARDRDRGYIKF